MGELGRNKERKGKERGRRWGRSKWEYKREDGEGSGLQRNEERVVAGGMRNAKGRRKGERDKSG